MDNLQQIQTCFNSETAVTVIKLLRQVTIVILAPIFHGWAAFVDKLQLLNYYNLSILFQIWEKKYQQHSTVYGNAANATGKHDNLGLVNQIHWLQTTECKISVWRRISSWSLCLYGLIFTKFSLPFIGAITVCICLSPVFFIFEINHSWKCNSCVNT